MGSLIDDGGPENGRIRIGKRRQGHLPRNPLGRRVKGKQRVFESKAGVPVCQKEISAVGQLLGPRVVRCADKPVGFTVKQRVLQDTETVRSRVIQLDLLEHGTAKVVGPSKNHGFCIVCRQNQRQSTRCIQRPGGFESVRQGIEELPVSRAEGAAPAADDQDFAV